MRTLGPEDVALQQSVEQALKQAIELRQQAKALWESIPKREPRARRAAFTAWTALCKTQSELEKVYYAK